MTPAIVTELLKASPVTVLAFMVWYELQSIREDFSQLRTDITLIAEHCK